MVKYGKHLKENRIQETRVPPTMLFNQLRINGKIYTVSKEIEYRLYHHVPNIVKWFTVSGSKGGRYSLQQFEDGHWEMRPERFGGAKGWKSVEVLSMKNESGIK